MAVAFIVTVLLLLRKTEKANALPRGTHQRPCMQFMLPVQATAHNAVYDMPSVSNNIEATDFALDLATWNSPPGTDRILKNITVSGIYQTSTQLCVPSQGSKKNFLQIATHGGGFDKRYWDSAINPAEYSYVNAALDEGYSILSYDRLGTGSSDRPDGATVVQRPLQLEILRRITEMARSGEIMKYACEADGSFCGDSGVSFEKVIHVGHSLGSLLTGLLLTSYGNLSDAAVLTGVITSTKGTGLGVLTALGVQYARQNDPHLFSNAGLNYLAPATASNMQTGFFSARRNVTAGIGGFEPEIIEYAYSLRQTETTGEASSFEQAGSPAPGYKGPVQFVVGQYDYLVCGGDCTGTWKQSTLEYLYPNASCVGAHVQLGTGHGLTLHRGAREGYQVTLDWLKSNGL